MKRLHSHYDPHLFLYQHIEQMRQVAQIIWNRHSPALRETCHEVWEWINDGITFHDTGKGSEFFQTYILKPDRYRGDKMLKAHTPLSLLCTLAHSQERRWEWPKCLAVSTLAAGHHSEFKTEEELRRVCSSDAMIPILERQLATLDWDALDAALVGVPLTRILCSDPEDIASDADTQIEGLCEQLRVSPASYRLSYRLRCQLAFSVLLEADKAFLAIGPDDVSRYLNPPPIELPPSLVDDFLSSKLDSAVNPLRVEARTTFLAGLSRPENARLQTMTLPTGTGKTLLGATWALSKRQGLSCDGSPPPKIIIVLPFLSIVDQTVEEYEKLLGPHVGNGSLVSYHSLSERTFDSELESKSQDFFLDTWQSDVVITTFDQLLLALFSPKTKHQLRFHNLTDALIVLDEVQSLPCILWEPLHQALSGLSALGSTHVLAMSATQPGFLPDATELISKPSDFFDRMRRYRLVLRHRTPMVLADFIAECESRLPDWKGRRVLLTLNTRRSARQVFNALREKTKLPVFFITGDKTPRDRLNAIRKIRKGNPCLVVSTQCIEAGVDIDMDFVIRDFATLDSLIQIAGRCNRNDNKPRGIVEIVSLQDDKSGKRFANMIYDCIQLQETEIVLKDLDTIDEENIYPLTRRYFDLLRGKKNCGAEVVETWLNWQEMKPIHRLFRGDQRPQLAFVVVDQAPNLPKRLEAILAIDDRWEKKRLLRTLAPEIARVTVTVDDNNKKDNDKFDPFDFAEPFPKGVSKEDAWFWLLNPGIYDINGGLDFERESEDELSWGVLL